jgi:hypothetical protein
MGKKGSFLRLALAGIFCNVYRLLRFIPNNDPIMGAMLPFARRGKWWEAGIFAFLTMVSFDLITMKLGVWTIVTGVTYGLLGIAFHFAYGKIKKFSVWTYIGSGVAGVLAFDFITGPIASSLMFGMPFWAALAGQVPFTLLHLASTTFFVAVLTPLLDRTIVGNERLSDAKVLEAVKA